MLQDVFMEDFAWPCLAYALRRAGIKIPPSEFFKLPRRPCPDDCPPGSVVEWDSGASEDSSEVDRTITVKNNTPITCKIKMDKHYGVIENNDLVSDLTIQENNWPVIRFRKFTPYMRERARLVIINPMLFEEISRLYTISNTVGNLWEWKSKTPSD